MSRDNDSGKAYRPPLHGKRGRRVRRRLHARRIGAAAAVIALAVALCVVPGLLRSPDPDDGIAVSSETVSSEAVSLEAV